MQCSLPGGFAYTSLDDLYGIMSGHNLKTLHRLCTAFSSSHVSGSTPLFLFVFAPLLWGVKGGRRTRDEEGAKENRPRFVTVLLIVTGKSRDCASGFSLSDVIIT